MNSRFIIRCLCLLATLWGLLGRGAAANPVPVRFVVDPSLSGGTVRVRTLDMGTGPWQYLGIASGSPSGDTFMLEDERRYDIKVEKTQFWTVLSAETEYQPVWTLRNNVTEADSLLITIANKPNSVNMSTVVFVVVVPIGLLVGGLAYHLVSRTQRRVTALSHELQNREQESIASIRRSLGKPRTPMPANLQIGPYRVEQKLGAGGMAAVYRVVDESGASYALKLPFNSAASDSEFIGRFQREIKICIGLIHPNIVRTVDAGTHPNDDGLPTPYLVMELVTGTELKQLLDVRTKADMAPDLDFAMRVAEGVLSGLGAAHEKGIIHRDVKPGNVMITDSGEIKVMDFGIARMENTKTLTAQGAVLGTPVYMAPEQISAPNQVDHRADLYACGVLLYAMTTHRLPYETTSEDIWALMMEKMMQRPPSPASINGRVSQAFADFIMRLIETKAEDRFPTARYALFALAWVRVHPDEPMPAHLPAWNG